MTKNMLDIMVMVIAFIAGLAISINHNPLMGVGLLLFVVTAWNLVPKIPHLIKIKVDRS